MSITEIVRFALRGLNSNKLRTSLTTLGIAIGVSSVIILLAVGNGSSKAVQAGIERLGTNTITIQSNRGGFGFNRRNAALATSSQPLTVGDAVALSNSSKAPHIKQAAPISSTNSTCSYSGNTSTPGTFYGTWPSWFEASNTPIATGTYFSNDDVTEGRKVAVIGKTVVTDLFNGENPLNKQIKCGSLTLTVIGVTATKGSSGFQDGDSLVVAPLTTIQRGLTGYNNLNSIVVQAKSAAVQTDAQNEINTILDARHKVKNVNNRDYRTLNQAQLLTTTSSNNKVFTVLLGMVAAISLLVGGIGITNIMLVTVVERTREIGIRKAIGAPKRAIMFQFLVEATILSLVGGLIGVVGGFIGSHFKIVGVQPVIIPASVFLAFGVSVLIGLFFGGYPASRAASLRPIEALRHE